MPFVVGVSALSRDQDTIHAEKGCAELRDFCMAAIMFLTGHWIEARTHVHADIANFRFGASSDPGKQLACFSGPDDAPH